MNVLVISHACQTCWGHGTWSPATQEQPPEFTPFECKDCDGGFAETAVEPLFFDSDGETCELTTLLEIEEQQLEYLDWLHAHGIDIYTAGGDCALAFELRPAREGERIARVKR